MLKVKRRKRRSVRTFFPAQSEEESRGSLAAFFRVSEFHIVNSQTPLWSNRLLWSRGHNDRETSFYECLQIWSRCIFLCLALGLFFRRSLVESCKRHFLWIFALLCILMLLMSISGQFKSTWFKYTKTWFVGLSDVLFLLMDCTV